jgi:hypothetical protein
MMFFIFSIFKEQIVGYLKPHLPLVVHMYNQKFFTLKTFPYTTTFYAWIGALDYYCVVS